ncbi:hypothetical protein CPC735_056340 [Coccidioides posadasii C735 delta SOWgp]|uniref:Aminoglycoside phosphotransferase domain-containing protein n=1 Tax=Coccidioides posadasii (strain C735) TaxID=222929 RepID=C5PIB1_COCP7|nr:hypothetical protein CPC735_056340 [Coccidioides posadasii C735 delta SOWgp]EER24264.1 hypothetical protein CPC735_056340 [Coccidioides posadasii C735 delta SOWgp]|eukprot:XP_003066409.1 hypothetical protein CPC735_056340 [Coccidioides posadasii C735 delta SOWgp]
MDLITQHRIKKEVEDFIASIDQSAVCELATSFHPGKKRCRIFDDVKKGGFNVCFPVEFTEEDNNTPGERWMVRIPILPRLAFPEEKLRGEIATMKFLCERTAIPLPRLHGYSITHDNPLGLPFMLLGYVEGKSLFNLEVHNLPAPKMQKLFGNLGEIYLQLFQHKFDRIGALTLDERDENWIFDHNRPLSVLMNDQTLAGIKPSCLTGPNQTFHSTIDYIYTLHQTLFDDFHQRRDSVDHQADARAYIYSLLEARQFLMKWVRPEYNHGPFILMHGDLRSANILVDDDLNIVSVLDWEWSHTIPIQMFVPPSWLDGLELVGSAKMPSRLIYETFVFNFEMETRRREKKYHPECRYLDQLPLAGIWRETLRTPDLFIAHGLLQPLYFGNIYWSVLEYQHYGDERIHYQRRMDDFFGLEIHKPELEAVQKKLQELELFNEECEKFHIEKETHSIEKSDSKPANNLEKPSNHISPPLHQRKISLQGFAQCLSLSESLVYWPLIGATFIAACTLVVFPRRK